jgi:hypothetical protein
MEYRFATERSDYSHLASGHVLYALPGRPAFPVRLASEIFQRCWAHRERNGHRSRCALYDPVCGAGYSLCVLGLLHREAIGTLLGSDVDAAAVQRAAKNLGLLSLDGLDRRMSEIEALLAAYGKDSHRAALQSARLLRERVAAEAGRFPLAAHVFQADVTAPQAVVEPLGGQAVDVVFADIPYGQHSRWQGAAQANPDPGPAWHMLETLTRVLAPGGIVAVVSGKQERVSHAGYQRLDQFQVGKRRVWIGENSETG